MKKAQQLRDRQHILEKELVANLLLLNGNGIFSVLEQVPIEDFAFYGKEIDSLKRSQIEGTSYMSDIKVPDFIVGFGFTRNIQNIVKDIKEISTAVKVYSILEESIQKIGSENVDRFVSDFQSKILHTTQKNEREKTDAKNLIEEYKAQQQFYKEKFLLKDGIIGIPTGYEAIDRAIDGFRKGHLWIIGGYTNTGKTQASLNFVSNLVKQEKRCVFYSLEMAKIDILSRLIGIMTGQSGLTVLKGYKHDEDSVDEAFKQIEKSRLSIHNQKTTLAEIEMSMTEEMIKNPVDLFIVDFIQLVTVTGAKSEYETITASALGLQNISKRLGVPIIVLSQISNEGAKGLNDNVMSFKGSGAIAAAADFAIELKSEHSATETRQKMNEGEPVLINWTIRKNRHGKVGNLLLEFNTRSGQFYEPKNDF